MKFGESTASGLRALVPPHWPLRPAAYAQLFLSCVLLHAKRATCVPPHWPPPLTAYAAFTLSITQWRTQFRKTMNRAESEVCCGAAGLRLWCIAWKVPVADKQGWVRDTTSVPYKPCAREAQHCANQMPCVAHRRGRGRLRVCGGSCLAFDIMAVHACNGASPACRTRIQLACSPRYGGFASADIPSSLPTPPGRGPSCGLPHQLRDGQVLQRRGPGGKEVSRMTFSRSPAPVRYQLHQAPPGPTPPLAMPALSL